MPKPNIGSAPHLMAQGKAAEAIAPFEATIALRPDLTAGYEGLSAACLTVGKLDVAIHAIARGLELKATPEAKTLFAQCVKLVRFTAPNERLHKLVLRALSEGWARPRELDTVCISLVKLNPTVAECVARATAAWPMLLPGAQLFGASGLAALQTDELLACLLQCDPVADIDLEILLTNIRHVMLTGAEGSDQAGDAGSLKFFAAVARQCFINEYVYALPQGEAQRARDLQSKLAQALKTGEPVPPLWPIAVGAYFPLHTTCGRGCTAATVVAGLRQRFARATNQGTDARAPDRRDHPRLDDDRRRGVAGGARAIRGEPLPALDQGRSSGTAYDFQGHAARTDSRCPGRRLRHRAVDHRVCTTDAPRAHPGDRSQPLPA